MKNSLNKIIALLLCFVMLSSIVLTSCDSGDSDGGGSQDTSQSTSSDDNSGDNSSQDKPSGNEETTESKPEDSGDPDDDNQSNNNGGGNEQTTVLATGVTLNKTMLSLVKGSSETLTATVDPADTTDKTLTWTTSNANVATVANGTVTAVSAGTATITVTTANGKNAICEVTVHVLASGVSLNKNTLSLIKGGSETLTATIAPSDTTDKTLTWTTSNANVATVANGTVTAIGAGTATITVTTANGKTATCEVTVSVLASGVSLNKNNLSLIKGGSETLTATVAPADTTDKTLTWTSSNASVATVVNGTVTAVGAGTATITVTTANGKTATCEITVSVLASGVSLNKNTLSLIKGSSEALTAIFSPDDTTDKTITWTSSDETVATVVNGVVTAKAEGIAVIIATTSNGLIASCSVTVQNAEVKTESISLSKTTATMNTGDTDTLTVSFNPTNVTNKELTWSSSNEKVVRVYDGVIIAVGSGSATVTATSENGKTASCTVTVSDDTGATVGSIFLDQSILNLQVGGFSQLNATVDVTGGSSYTVIWASSDPSVATVANGFIMTYSAGSAVITAMVKGTTISAICYVEVSEASSGSGSTVSAWKQQELLKDLPEPTFGSCTGVNFNGATYVNVSRSEVLSYISLLENTYGYRFSAVSNDANVYAGTGTKGTKKVSIGWTLNGNNFSVLVQDSSSSGSESSGGSSSSTVMPSSVSLDKQTATLEVGDYVILTPTVSPSNTTDKRVGWSSSKPSVAYVKNGIVMAMGKGTATITVHTENGKTATCVITVIKKAESVILDKTIATMNRGDTLTLNAIVLPADVSDASVTWTTSNENVVTVVDGVLTAVGAGTATITVTEKYGKMATCTVTVVIPTTGISLNTSTQNMAVGDTNTLTATVAPFDATDKNVVWHSSDEAVATVDQNGKVTAIKGGTSIITATASNGSVASCVVNVSSVGLNLNNSSFNVVIGYSKDLVATVTPDYTVNKAISWSSSDLTVASVDSNGKVTAHKKGTAVITATHTSSGTTAVCTVTVTAFELSFSTLNVSGTTTNDVFSNSTVDFDFKNEVTIIGDATYVVSLDEYGNETIDEKKVSLTEGDNVFYIIATDGVETSTYTVNIRRRPIYSVIFEPENGTSAKTVEVEEGCCVTPPEFTYLGYDLGWDTDLKQPITTSLTVTAVWTLRDDMKNFEFDSTATTCIITGYKDKTVEEIILPGFVTGIGSSAFYNFDSLKRISIPYGVTVIDDEAFYECTSLMEVSIPDSVTIIGDEAFYLCSKMTKLTLGNKVTSIGEYAFYACTGLVSITLPGSISTIKSSAFYGCYKLVEVINLSSLELTAGWSTNGYVAGYAKVIHRGNSKIVNKGDYQFYTHNEVNYLMGYTGSSTEIILPSDYNGEVYDIYKYAFYNWENNLTDVTIPNGVTGIGEFAFYDCNIKNIEVPYSVKNIGKAAFKNCRMLISITLPFMDTYFGYYFGANSYSDNYSNVPASIETVVITGGTTLCDYAFYKCSMLTSVAIPNSITSIGKNAFEHCTSLTNVHTSDISAWCEIKFGNISANPLYYAENFYLNGEFVTEITIPDSITSICEYALLGVYRLTSITVADGNTKYHSESNCLIETESKTLILGCKNSVIPNDGSVTSIGDYAFYGCTELTNITIPNSVTSIAGGAFWACSSIESITLPFVGGSASATSASNSTLFGYIFGTSSYTGGIKTEQYYKNDYGCYCNYYIPSSLRSVTITGEKILFGAFDNCTRLASITISNNVTRIDDMALNGCTGLTSITVEESNTVYHSSGDCLIKTASKTLILGCNNSVIPSDGSVTSIGKYAFLRYEGLVSITIPNSVTSIDPYAFYRCTGLTSITVAEGNAVYHSSGNCLIETASKTLILGCKNSVIPSDGSVTSIGEEAFAGCTGLTSITIPDSVTSIKSYAFEGCTGLTDIKISNSVTSIYGIFYGCTKLTSITIPDSVTSIGTWTFYGCTRLKNVYYTGTSTEWKDISIGVYNTNLTSATRYYYSETEPTDTTYNSWHYVDGVPTKW